MDPSWWIEFCSSYHEVPIERCTNYLKTIVYGVRLVRVAYCINTSHARHDDRKKVA